LGKRSWQGLIWSAVTVVILLSFMTPFIVFTISFLMIPVLILYVKLSTRRFIIHYVISLLIVYVLSGWQGAFLIAVSLFFLPPVLVMGNLYKRKAPGRSVVTAGVVALLAESLLTLVISYAFGLNPIAKFKQFMNDYIVSMPVGLRDLLPKDHDWYIHVMVQVIPLDLIVFALFYSFVTHGVGRWLLNKSGEALPGLPPLREWKLPRTFVWIYLIAFVMDLFLDPSSNSLIATLLMNMLPLLVLSFSIQAISFFFYVAHANRWNRAFPIIALVVLVFIPPLMFIYSLLGVFDVAFPIRERFKKNN
jgi:uncharacterized protein YybS (DUF2232 family)